LVEIRNGDFHAVFEAQLRDREADTRRAARYKGAGGGAEYGCHGKWVWEMEV
jgi:hypothetical protein